MSKRSKLAACFTVGLALLLYFFFDISKHQPVLAQVNAFADDPYDAVGSFGVQFAALAALLSLVRAFRPYQPGQTLDIPETFFTQGAYATCASATVILGADIIAMVRYPSVWLGFSAGLILALLVGGMVLFTMLVIWLIHRSARKTRSPATRNTWIRTGSISIACILILAFYPASWRQSIHGAIFTAFVGIVIFFGTVWAWSTLTMPAPAISFEDSIDDLASIYRWLKAHAGYFRIPLIALEKVRRWPFMNATLRWLNPRKHTWNGVLLLGILMGIVLALAEMLGEGGPGPREIGRFVMIVGIFVGLEGIGVLLGYALLARPLGLFRHTSKL